MCQITVVNLHDEILNAKLFLFLGTIGSMEHGDGWGTAKAHKASLKTALPMYLTSNSGIILREDSGKFADETLLGHIRKASPSVPICDENSHPFVIDGVTFVHNGKLTPLDEKKHHMDDLVEEVDIKDPTKITKKYIKRSDSLIFFEYFMKLFKENTETDLNKKFVDVLNKAMEEFYGTFAFVFIINNSYFLVRGKTKELNVMFLRNKKGANIGWVVNTSGKLLDFVDNFLANISMLNNEDILDFSDSETLKAETIFVADKYSLNEIGEIKENDAPVTPWQGGATNFTGKTTGGKKVTTNGDTSPAVVYAGKVYNFMTDYSLTVEDINNLILGIYELSTQEVEEYVIKHFCDVVIPLIRNHTNKNLRKRVAAEHPYGVSRISYIGSSFQYPWVLNTKGDQALFLTECLVKGGKK